MTGWTGLFCLGVLMRGAHTLTEWETIKLLYDFTCAGCGRTEPQIKLTEDHKIPISKAAQITKTTFNPFAFPVILESIRISH